MTTMKNFILPFMFFLQSLCMCTRSARFRPDFDVLLTNSAGAGSFVVLVSRALILLQPLAPHFVHMHASSSTICVCVLGESKYSVPVFDVIS
ncbi:unnamed protein product [Amoebophrya sp. A25]|nr:unnamed protein product [Amoebophrya sp. A25]|eukprot:GSA25T00002254001.1